MEKPGGQDRGAQNMGGLAPAPTVATGVDANVPSAPSQSQPSGVGSIGQSAPAAEQPAAPVQPWGNLDAIPTPSSGPAMSGLGASMIPKVKAQSAATDSPLRSSLYKERSITSPEDTSAPFTLASLDAAIVGESTPPETDSQAKEVVDRALASKEYGKQTSDYIFAIANVDPRTLGRIAGWVDEVEKKDKYLTPHAIAVAEYACDIAKALNLSPREIDDIRLSALLHDIGKLGTSTEILQKRDEDLDDTELLTMMRHPLDGAELLESFPDLAGFAPVVLAHHEEFAGTGYPQGLKGEEIPLPARIIFLANSYHGLISDKNYGKGMSVKQAKEHLQEQSGKQSDPALVDVFLRCLKDDTQH